MRKRSIGSNPAIYTYIPLQQGCVSIYTSTLQLDDLDVLLMLDLQKDKKKMHFCLLDVETGSRQELSLFIKQA